MSIVDRVRPSVQGLLELGISSESDAFRHQAVKANVRTSVDHLRHGSAILEQLILNDGLIVVGAEYSVESGEVEFFD
jgi:carbonic anhydrase